jgi:Outer membrane protein
MRRTLFIIFYGFVTLVLFHKYAGAQSAHEKQLSQDLNSTASSTIILSLDDLIAIAKEQSLDAMVAKHNFVVQYWQFRSYKAQFLPALNLSTQLGQYNRSLLGVQNSETGKINYVVNDNLRNSLTLSIDQNIPLTGGIVSVNTSLLRLDQFSPNNSITYNSQPINVEYSQPLMAYNSLKWQKKIEPKRFELAKRQYLEDMENVTIVAANMFFNLLSTQNKLEIAKKGHANSLQSYEFAKERFNIGSVTKDQLLELELRILNDEISIRDMELQQKSTMMKVRNFLGYNESVNIQLIMPELVNNITLSYDDVMNKVNNNSSFTLQNEISNLESDQDVAKSKANTGLQAKLFAQFGLTNVNNNIPDAYKSPQDQEIIGLSLQLPILDWGLGKGRVEVAKSRKKVIQLQLEQSVNSKQEDILLKVMQFNIQGAQCIISQKADSIGRERYRITSERFQNGAIQVRDLNTAQTEMDNANNRYISDLSNYWQYYYIIQKLSLYNYIKNENISADFNKLAGETINEK